jgi:hypothetical protein
VIGVERAAATGGRAVEEEPLGLRGVVLEQRVDLEVDAV